MGKSTISMAMASIAFCIRLPGGIANMFLGAQPEISCLTPKSFAQKGKTGAIPFLGLAVNLFVHVCSIYPGLYLNTPRPHHGRASVAFPRCQRPKSFAQGESVAGWDDSSVSSHVITSLFIVYCRWLFWFLGLIIVYYTWYILWCPLYPLERPIKNILLNVSSKITIKSLVNSPNFSWSCGDFFSLALRPVCVTLLLQMLAELELAGTMTGASLGR